MIKEINVTLHKKIPTGGLSFTVLVETFTESGNYPIEQPVQGATVEIIQEGQTSGIKGWTDENGKFQEPKLPIDQYIYKVEFPDYEIEQGTVTVE